MSAYRLVSPGERVFHLVKETGTWSRKFIQVVFEGEGELNPEKWKAAMVAASAVHKSFRLVLRGHLGFSRWDGAGPEPTVTEVFADWDGFDFDRPFLWRTPIDLRQGPIGEVVLIQGRTPRVLMRIHHAVTDGVGALTFAQDLFRILRGEAPVGSNSTATEIDVWRAANFGTGKTPSAPANAIIPFEPREGSPNDHPVWKRISIPGRIVRIIPKLAVGVAEQSRRLREGIVRIALFVNLRRHLDSGQITTANCSGMIVFDVAPDDTLQSVSTTIRSKFHLRTYLDMSRYVSVVRWVPAALFQAGPRSIRRQYRTGLFRASAYITHIGSFSPDLYSYADFRATRLIPIAPSDPTTPLNLVIVEGNDSVELVAHAPRPLAGNGKLDAVVDALRTRLVEDGPGVDAGRARGSCR